MSSEYDEQKQAGTAPERSSAYGELIRQVDRIAALTEEAEQRLAAVLSPPFEHENVPKRDRFPSALGDHVSKLSDLLDKLSEILRRVDL